MDQPGTCPRCAAALSPPNVWSSSWQCSTHGAVPPVHEVRSPTAGWVRHVCATSRVPVWLPWPLPAGWVVTAVAPVGDEVTGIPAVAVALACPSPLGGPAEVLLVSEEPGVGFAARLAGLAGTDPGEVVHDSPYTRAEFGGHPVPLWLVPNGAETAVVVGERDLVWIWILVRPAAAGAMLVDELRFTDAREIGEEVRLLPYGARSTWLDPG
jgi:hypothetical protein